MMLHLGDAITLPALAIREVSGTDGATWARHDVIEGKPRSQWMGPDAKSLTLPLYLHASFIAPRPTLTALQQVMAQAEPLQVWTDAGSYWGTYVITAVQYRFTWTLPGGQVIAMTCDVTLSEPGDEAVLKRPAGVAAYAVPEVVAPRAEQTDADPGTVSPSQVVRR